MTEKQMSKPDYKMYTARVTIETSVVFVADSRKKPWELDRYAVVCAQEQDSDTLADVVEYNGRGNLPDGWDRDMLIWHPWGSEDVNVAEALARLQGGGDEMSPRENLWNLVSEIYPVSKNLRDLGHYTLPEALKDAAIALFTSGESDTTRAIEIRAAIVRLREEENGTV